MLEHVTAKIRWFWVRSPGVPPFLIWNTMTFIEFIVFFMFVSLLGSFFCFFMALRPNTNGTTFVNVPVRTNSLPSYDQAIQEFRMPGAEEIQETKPEKEIKYPKLESDYFQG